MPSDPWPIWGILVFLLVVIINGYFAMAVRAVDSAKTVSERENMNSYEIALKALNVLLYMIGFACLLIAYWNPMTYLTVMYLGLSFLEAKRVLACLVILIIAAILFLGIGEAFPRRLAVLHDDAIAPATLGSVKFLTAVMKPLTACGRGISTLLLLIFRQKTDVEDNDYSEEDIVEMLEVGSESGELKEEGKKMITGVFAFDDTLAYEIMTPRTDVFAIDINDPAEEYIDELMELRYSRIPVYEDDLDDVIGILYIKDYLIKAREEGFDNVDIQSILRKPYFVPETKNIDSLFFELQKTKQHIAILIDEYGGFCGIVTMEDIIEEVMGDIDDEYDIEEQEIRKIAPNTYIIDGGTDLDDIDEEIGIDLQSEDSETIGGFIIDILGEIPDKDDIGKEIDYENYVFTIKSVKDRRIEQVSMKIGQPDE